MKYENDHQRKDVNIERNSSSRNKGAETSIMESVRQKTIMEAFFNVLRVMEIKSNIANPLPREQRELISGLLPNTVS